jgi:prepilin-type N-terminal cleavage/methylation domain-containing protein
MNLRQAGFTLMEVAIAIVIVSVLLGYTVAMLPLQQERKQYRAAEAEMDLIVDSLIAFAQVNGRLPCPDTTGNVHNKGVAGVLDGQEDRTGTDACKSYYGFLPAATLGINGNYNSDNQILDPWSQPYRYAVSNFNFNGSGSNSNLDYVTEGGIRDEGLSNVTPNLALCDDSAEIGDDLNCGAVTGIEVIPAVAAVVLSLGRENSTSNDGSTSSSNIQTENTDNFHNGLTDRVFIKSERREDYDDVVRSLSNNLLITRMIEAGQLP